MAAPRTRAQFIDYCKRRLGHPVIQINVDDDQVEDRIDDALQFFHDYHFDGCEQIFMKHMIQQSDIDRGWIYCPDTVLFVTGVIPFDQSSSSVNMFDLRYQLRLHDLYDFTSVSYVSYEITMQHIRTLNLLFSGTPNFRFNRHQNKLFLDIDWTRDVQVGQYVVMECYRKLDPDNQTMFGTANVTTSSVDVVGVNTKFDQDMLPGDEVSFGTEMKRVVQISSPTNLKVDTPFITTETGLTMVKTGISDVWNDRFLKRYATAMIKLQWGNNLSKFAGIQMPGGVTLDGVRIATEAQAEIDKIEEEMQSYNVLPGEFFLG
jgi:hypothetical protein